VAQIAKTQELTGGFAPWTHCGSLATPRPSAEILLPIKIWLVTPVCLYLKIICIIFISKDLISFRHKIILFFIKPSPEQVN